MIEDISLDGEFFDSDFFVYREDADVAWRAQLMGWKCLYVPYARGYHVRKVLPGNRRALPPEINMHSVKNRFLMRIKNISSDLYWRNWFSITGRDVLVVMCCLLWEHTSLKAFWFLAQELERVLAKRALIQAPARVDDEYMASWFQYTPVSKRAPKKMVRVLCAPRPPRLSGDFAMRSFVVGPRARHASPYTGAGGIRRGLAPAARAVTAPRMRIAILGTRGIPANYGGFETFAEELSTRLAARGHQVTVYCRERHPQPVYRGVRLLYLPTIRHKYFDTLAHTFVLHPASAGAPRGRGALLQRRQRYLHLAAAPVRHTRGAQRGRHRAQAQEVESRWPRPGTWFPSGWPRSAPPWW